MKLPNFTYNAKTVPSFAYEKRLWRKGYKVVAGVDEVGRGSFAGPVVAGACTFSPQMNNSLRGQNSKIKINDSKKLTPKQRERTEKWIKENVLAWGIGEVTASLINRIGMAKATKMAFRKAIKSLNIPISQYPNIFLLIDAFYIPFVRGIRRKNQLAIINGDEKCLSIAAASIVAKVYRDALMQKLGLNPKYKKYGWGRNKGYGTKEHREAIKKYGLTKYHRKKFVSSFFSSQVL